MASGEAENATITKGGEDFEAFRAALEAVCISLAKQMATDGEGATKYVEVRVKNAKMPVSPISICRLRPEWQT